MLQNFPLFNLALTEIKNQKHLITTINAHCYNLSQKDKFYKEALLNSDVLIPDGISVVWAVRWLTGQNLKKIAGADLFYYEMNRLQGISGSCFFLGSSDENLSKIKKRIRKEYPAVKVQVYSPPFKSEFSLEENTSILTAINKFKPDVLMIGMTAPKQEKWAYMHYDQLQVGHICCIGAVFDFYAGTIKRAPNFMVNIGLEWLYRFIMEPRRMWRRYLIGNIIFIWSVVKEKVFG